MTSIQLFVVKIKTEIFYNSIFFPFSPWKIINKTELRTKRNILYSVPSLKKKSFELET